MRLYFIWIYKNTFGVQSTLWWKCDWIGHIASGGDVALSAWIAVFYQNYLPARLRKFAGRLSVAFLPWPGKHHVFGQVNKPHLTNLRSTTRSKCKGPQITCHYPDYIQIQIRCYCVTSWGQTVLRMGMSAQVLNVDVNIRPAYRVIACFLYNQSDVTRPNVTGDQQEWRRNVQCELV